MFSSRKGQAIRENSEKIASIEEKMDALPIWAEEQMVELSEKIESMGKAISEMQSEMENYKKYKEEKQLLKNAGEPWVDFETRVVEDGRVEVKMDWNREFIDYLKREGINAPSEEEMVSIYFSSLVREAGEELSEEEAEKYSK